jgi:rubrerythrin
MSHWSDKHFERAEQMRDQQEPDEPDLGEDEEDEVVCPRCAVTCINALEKGWRCPLCGDEVKE